MSETQLPQFLFTYWNPFDEKKPDFADSLDTYVKDVQLANYIPKPTHKLIFLYPAFIILLTLKIKL